MKYTATPEELNQLIAQNESFKGRKVNFQKMHRYQELKAELKMLMEKTLSIKDMKELTPEPSHRSAIITLEFDAVVMLLDDLFPLFKRAIEKCDGFTISCAGNYPAISFTISNMWEE